MAITANDQLRDRGLGFLSKEASQMLSSLRSLKRERHYSRVEEAMAVALKAAYGVSEMLAFELLRLEEEASMYKGIVPTKRMAPFRGLGTGRRLAHDGAAWTAAIRAAAAIMRSKVPQKEIDEDEAEGGPLYSGVWTPRAVLSILGVIVPSRHEEQLLLAGLLEWWTIRREQGHKIEEDRELMDGTLCRLRAAADRRESGDAPDGLAGEPKPLY